MNRQTLVSFLYELMYDYRGHVESGWWNDWLVFPNGWRISAVASELGYIEIAVINPEGNRIEIDGEHAERALDTLDGLNEWVEKVANYD